MRRHDEVIFVSIQGMADAISGSPEFEVTTFAPPAAAARGFFVGRLMIGRIGAIPAGGRLDGDPWNRLRRVPL